ncbi:MAG: beta-N-acetylhexosaminidase, partial [Bacteroidales bacterium]
KKPQLVFEVKPSKRKRKGAYRIKMDESEIRLTGYNEEGLFYAMQTLIQLLPPDSGCTELIVPVTEIFDEPQLEYRSMHLDVARHIFSVDYLKQFIDYLAMHKMNVFHWHLTDDQGWRIEIPEYPRLTETGAWRDATIIGVYPGTGIDSTRYGGFYTQKEVREIVKYAGERYITIIPEIDIPGHCMAVIASYPELSTDPSKSYKVAETWGIFNKQNNVLAPSADAVCFMEAVFKNVAELFPGPYIHFGGDECSLKWWKESPLVQQFMKENRMDDERQVQRWFVKQAERIIAGLGKKAIAWGEALDADASLNTIIMSWKNEKAGIAAAQKGHRVIMSPQRYAYFNHKQIKEEKAPSHPLLVTVDSVYRFPIYPKALSAKENKQIIGASGCLWTEYYPTEKRVEYAVFPRMTALSEVLWGISGQNRKKMMTEERWLLQKARYDLWKVDYCEAIRIKDINGKNDFAN